VFYENIDLNLLSIRNKFIRLLFKRNNYFLFIKRGEADNRSVVQLICIEITSSLKFYNGEDLTRLPFTFLHSITANNIVLH